MRLLNRLFSNSNLILARLITNAVNPDWIDDASGSGIKRIRRAAATTGRSLADHNSDLSNDEEDQEEAYQEAPDSNSDEEEVVEQDQDEFQPEKKSVGVKKSTGGGGGIVKLKLSGNTKALYSGSSKISAPRNKNNHNNNSNANAGAALVSSIFAEDRDFGSLYLKPDHATRPFYISPISGTIILEAFHPLAAQATDFLIAIAEPISRPTHIHEYKLTPHSLYAAVSVGLKTEDIIEALNRMSKVPVPEEISNFIRECTISYGKVKLVLKKNKHYVESGHAETLRILLRDEIISKARVIPNANGEDVDGRAATATYGIEKEKAPKRAGLIIPGTKAAGVETPIDPLAKGKGKEVPTNADDLFTAVVGLEKGKSSYLVEKS